jgi:hypothetical protein
MKIKLDIKDFIYEVFEELICYDEIGEQGAKKWAADFEIWLNDGRKKKNVVVNGGNTYFVIEDEGEIFDIADEYLEAVENNALEKYWKDFQ